MRRKFVPLSFERNHELMREFIKEGKTFIQGLDGFFHREAKFEEKFKRLLDEKRKREIRMREKEERKEEQERIEKKEKEIKEEQERRGKEEKEKKKRKGNSLKENQKRGKKF